MTGKIPHTKAEESLREKARIQLTPFTRIRLEESGWEKSEVSRWGKIH